MAELDISLIVVACILPFILIMFNLVVMAHYIDPQAAAGHFIAKFVIVGGSVRAGPAGKRTLGSSPSPHGWLQRSGDP